jgi:nucleotide-binding universal stress UspA family protein
MLLEKILLPVEFSGNVMQTGRYAMALAVRFHSELTIVHVFYLLKLMPPEWYEDARGAPQRLLDVCCAEEFKDLRVRRLLLEGDVAGTIVDLARREHTDLIVMPTHGYGGFRRFLLGSVTAKLLHDADCPVLTGTHKQHMPPPEPVFFRNIVCAIDFDAAGEKALRWAAAFAAEFQSHLTVVHARPSIEASLVGSFDLTLPAKQRTIARERMEELQRRLGTAAEVILESGRIADLVRDAGTSQRADLMVIGRHESPGVVGRLRSNAYAIIRESPCPVVSV